MQTNGPCLEKREYKVAFTAGLSSSIISSVNCVFDTAAEKSSLHEDIIDPNWIRSIVDSKK